eukprot:m51a1_g6843 hypothetical protein (436) ;mRNA; f:78816-80123
MKTTAAALTLTVGLAGLALVCTAQSDCEAQHTDELAKCLALLQPCQPQPPAVSSSSSGEIFAKRHADEGTTSSGASDACGCYFEYLRCFKEVCPKSSSATIAGRAGIAEDQCKDKAPDCYYSIWGDPHFVVAAAGGQRKSMASGGWSQPGERHFSCGLTDFPDLYTSASMAVAGTAEAWPYMQAVTSLQSVTVTLKPSGKVYTTSKKAFGFDTSASAPAGFVVTKEAIAVLATNERLVVHDNWGFLTAEIWGYCDVQSTVQKGCDSSDDDKNSNVIGFWPHTRRSVDDAASVQARVACSAVGDGFVAACELDVKATGDPAFADQAAEASARFANAGEFLESYAAPTAAAAAGATTATVAIAAGVTGGVVGAVALAGGVGAAVYVAKKKQASRGKDEAMASPAGAGEVQTHGGVNVMNAKPGVHQSITGRAPPVEV